MTKTKLLSHFCYTFAEGFDLNIYIYIYIYIYIEVFMIKKEFKVMHENYLACGQVPLKTKINLFKNLLLSHLDFNAMFVLQKYLSFCTNYQTGQLECKRLLKFDIPRDQFLETKILPAELQIISSHRNFIFQIKKIEHQI